MLPNPDTGYPNAVKSQKGCNFFKLILILPGFSGQFRFCGEDERIRDIGHISKIAILLTVSHHSEGLVV